MFQIPCQSWFDDMNDRELLDLIPLLEQLSQADAVYRLLKETFNSNKEPGQFHPSSQFNNKKPPMPPPLLAASGGGGNSSSSPITSVTPQQAAAAAAAASTSSQVPLTSSSPITAVTAPPVS